MTALLQRPEARLLFGSAEIHAPDPERFWANPQGEHPYAFVVLSDGFTFGHPEPEMVEVPSQLMDGVIVTTMKNGNRQIECVVEIQSSTAEGLAQGEQTLMREVNRARGVLQRNSFTSYPAQPFGEPTVFIVLEADLVYEYEDLRELRCRRHFRLILTCMPFGRSAEEIVTPAIGTGDPTPLPAPVETVINDASSTAGWSGLDATITALSGNRVVATGTAGATLIGLRYTPDFSMSSDPLLVVNHYTLGITTGTVLSVQFAGSSVAKLLQPIAVLDGWSYYEVGAGSTITEVRIVAGFTPQSASKVLYTRGIKRISRMPYVGTDRQLFRSLRVLGTAPAPASLELAHSTTGLGPTLIYTSVEDGSGGQPPLMRLRTSGPSRVPDASTKSGAYSPMTAATTEVFDIPTRQVPEGLYEILAAARRPGPDGRSFTFSASTRMADGTDRDAFSDWRYVPPAEFDPLGGWAIVSVGQVSLPRLVTEGAGSVRITLKVNANTDVDDVWLCNLTTGHLTVVNAGTSRRLWLDSPTLDRPRRTIWLGNAEDRSDARHATDDEVRAWGSHQFLPGAVNAFSACDAVNAALSLRQHKWFMHNVAASSGDEDEAA